MKYYDIVVIGAGPAALTFLKFLDKSFNVMILEKNINVGYREHCAGIIGHRLVKIIGKSISKNILNKYYTINISATNALNLQLYLKRNTPIYLIDRVNYERDLYSEVKDHFNFLFKRFVVKVFKNFVVTKNHEKYFGKIIINAEGALHKIRRQIVGKENPWGKIVGIQEDFEASVNEINEFTVIFSDKYAKGFFGWVVPIDEKHIRIGVGGENVSIHLLNSFEKYVERHRLSRLHKKIRTFGGIILREPPRRNDFYNNIVMLGDAAYHVKPVTGGGLYVQTLFSKALATSCSQLNEDDKIKHVQLMYKSLTKNIRLALKIQGVLSKVLHASSEYYKKRLINAIRNYGKKIFENVEYDHHEVYVSRIMENPYFMLSLLSISLNSEVFKGLINSLGLFLR